MKKTLALWGIILTVSGCNLFDKDERLLAEYNKTTGEKIKIYYVSLGATTNDVIQVRKSNQDTPIWALDKYNFLKSSKLITDTTLQLVLSDSGVNKFDTIIVNIK